MNILSNSNNFTAVIMVLFLLGCNSQESAETNHTDHATEEEHTAETKVVELSDLQMKSVGIQTGRFSRLPLQNSIKANGVLELPPQNKADVSALVPGAIRKINVIEGDRVNKGQVLALLEHPNIIDMQQDYVDASEKLIYLELEYKRKKQLIDEEVGSQSEFQQIASEYQSGRARALALRGKLELLGLDPEIVLSSNIRSAIPIRSPLEGYVRVIEVNTGSYVTPGQKMFEIVDNHHIHIDLMVYEKGLHLVRDDQLVYFRYTNQPDDKLYNARIFAVGKAFEQEPKAIRVHAELIEPQPDLLPGMYVEAWIVTGNNRVLALPEEAVVTDGGSKFIFVRDKDQNLEHTDIEQTSGYETSDHETRFRATEVITGITDNGFVEIKLLEDLSDHSEVVTKGAFFILSEMKKGEGGHHH